jgi:crotonobetainyl-CoA:carnitine CoA-transferase CaiB-like acyl-CoA transferase
MQVAGRSRSRLPLDDLPTAAPGPGLTALAGLKVLDLTTSIAGPYAAMLLGDLGADVVKIERRAGDDARGWGPPFLDGNSLWYLSVNRNKRSVVLDFTSEAGRPVLDDLVRGADVVLLNQPAHTLAKLKLDARSLRELNPRLIHVSISGFGATGERADWVCYDLIAEGYSGVMDLTGEADGDAQKIGAPAADMLAGMDAAFATLAAVIDRNRTGTGTAIEVALADSMIRFLTCRIVPYLGSGELPRRSGGKDSVIAIYQSFETADLPITLGLGTDAIWKRFWEAVGSPSRAEHADTASNALRRERRADIVAEISRILAERPRAAWLEVFAKARVPAGPISRVDEVVRDPEFLARGLFYAVDGADGKAVPQVGLGVRFDEGTAAARLPPPRLGAHSRDILASWLGYDQARLDALEAADIIRGDRT